ncbi:GntR family transcriptional regulator [Streptococcus merionis]|uniref:GntR family transcriptional regulator n=1 Tax=Streptococcus merionis TaxID=400065 RepID=UPI00351371C3
MPKVDILNVSYQKVALELATQIVEGKYHVGERVKSRSTIATSFHVSPETARKAINILADLGIMEVKQGSGAVVISKEKAEDYVRQFEATTTLKRLEKELQASLKRQQEELVRTKELALAISNQATLVHKEYPFQPFEMLVTKSDKVGQSLNELNVWHQTGATIIAIMRADQLILSPGPYASIQENDVLYFVGNGESQDRMRLLFSI